ncbi:hypothetical protein DB347_06330 [Opitutaceae bacterium EW11]|nr:hypothetical protein DB347_06330 [Opitutaceae bacterium EW11]
MNELKLALTALCEELGLEPPEADARGRYEVRVEELVLRLGPWGKTEVVLEGVIGNLGRNAAGAWETQQEVLRQVLTWNIGRLKGQPRPEILSFDEEENLLLLWRTWPLDERLTAAVLQGAEEMLNELEFWRSKILSVAPTFGQEGAS